MTRRMGTILAVFVVMVVVGAALSYAQPVEEIRGLIEDFAGDEYDRTKQAHRRLVEIGKPGIPYLADAVKDTRKNVRWRAVQVLGAIGGDEVVPPLLLALADADKDVRRYAVAFLGRWGKDESSVPSAVKQLLYDPEPQVVWHAMAALDELGDSSYKTERGLMEALCPYLEGPDDDRREHAARALAMIGSGQACPALVKALGSPESSGACRNAIVGAIGKIGSRNAVPLLLQLFTNEAKEKKVRFKAAAALQLLADPSIDNDLLALTASPEGWLRRAAVKALGFKENAQVVSKLGEIVIDEGEATVLRTEAARSLGAIGDPRAVGFLAKALSESSFNFRREAIRALGTIGCADAVPHLLELLGESDPLVVPHAAQALGAIGDKRAVEPLVRLFYREDAIEGPLAANPMFANIATVAHYALVRITGKLENYLGDLRCITNQEQLGKTRALWRIKLQLNRKQ